MITNGARVLKSYEMLPHLNIPIKLCLYQCFSSFSQSVSSVASDSLQPHEWQHARPPCPSSLIVHKSLLGILFKCRFLIKWGLKFQFLKKPLDDADAVNSVRLLVLLLLLQCLGLFWVTNVTQANGLAISLLDFAYVDESRCHMAIISEHPACTLFGFVSHRSHVTFFIQLSPWAPVWGKHCGVSAVSLGAAVFLDVGCHGLA